MRLSNLADRLVHGAVIKENELLLPASGGGIALPEIKGEGPRWLNLVMTVLADHAQTFELRVYCGGEAPRVIIRFGLMPHFRAAVALDLNWLDGHILFPGHRVGTQKVVCHGSRIDRNEISQAELVSMPGAKEVRVKIENLALENEPCPAEAPCDGKLIDAFGQYIPKDWPGKVKNEEEMVPLLRKEASEASAYPFPHWTEWGGDGTRKLKEGTGFFSKIKRDGRWYLTDPSGCAFFSMGPDCVVARCDARIDGLEEMLTDLPPREGMPGNILYGPMRANWGEVERPGGTLFSYERWNLYRAFGESWEEAWQSMIVGQLKRMGMNSLGNWSDSRLFGRMPYVTSLPEFPATAHCIFRDFPDVLSPEYAQKAEKCAQALEERKNDPWMIGYFLRNEPAWAFVDDLIIADEVLRDPAPTACKAGLIAFIQEKYTEIDALNQAWHVHFESFGDLENPIEKASSLSDQAKHDLRAFSAILTEKYMRIPAEACRKIDPNHMILGMRWAWISDPLLVTGWDCFDVFSINCYAVDPTPALDRVRDLGVDLPVMIGEFHFGALDGGLPATGLEAVLTQKERAKAYRYYCERAAAHPNGVGCHWFQCYDQFALGRFDGENYNIGLFDITLRPYAEMAKAVRDTAERAYAVHAGEKAPFSQKPVSLPMIAY